MTAAQRFRAARLKSGLSQVAVAESLGLPQSNVSRIESGKLNPTLEWLCDAADRLGWAREELDERLAPRREP